MHLIKRWRKQKGQSGMDNSEKFATLGTQDTGRECLFYHDGCLIRGRNGTDHPSGGPWVQLYFFGGIVLLIFLVFCVVFYFANLVLCLVNIPI
jgi:hypothetical protein